MFDFKKEFKLAFSENKLAIIVSVLILFSTLILGYYLEPYLYDFLNPVVEELTKNVKSGVIKLSFQSIFLNNIKIVFLMFILGVLFCFSALILAFNGFFVGYFIANTGDFLKTAILIIPHGIFEFSSCILACASGFVLFKFICKFFKNLPNQKDLNLKNKFGVAFDLSFDKLKQALLLLFISSILMAIAGFIEVYLTLPIADFIFQFIS